MRTHAVVVSVAYSCGQENKIRFIYAEQKPHRFRKYLNRCGRDYEKKLTDFNSSQFAQYPIPLMTGILYNL